jgi:hypothetical protein
MNKFMTKSNFNFSGKSTGLIVAAASLISGILYFVFVAPVHAEFAHRHAFGGVYYYFYLGFVLVFMTAGIALGVREFLWDGTVEAATATSITPENRSVSG